MRKQFIIIIMMLVTVFISCKKNQNLESDPLNSQNNKILKADSNFISLDMALALATSVKTSSQSEKVANSRQKSSNIVAKSNSRKVKDYFVYSEVVNNATARAKNVTNSMANEPLLYVVNFEGGGACVVSSDKRFGEVIADFDNNTTISQGMEAPDAFINFMEHASRTIKAIKEDRIKYTPKSQQPIDIDKKNLRTSQIQQQSTSSVNVIPGTYEEECFWDLPDGLPFPSFFPPQTATCKTDYNTYTIYSGPFVQTQWGQGAGYNDLVPLICGSGKAPTGCVATAMAQALSVYKFPTTYNWLSMNDYTGSPETARLMRDLGSMVNMSYGCDGSGAYMSAANAAFRSLGINTSYVDMDNTSNSPSLEQFRTWITNRLTAQAALGPNPAYPGSPVMAGGCQVIGQTGWWIFKRRYYSSCHAWLIDGRRLRRYCSTERVPGSNFWYYIYEEESFHFNFGWNGSFNGWYKLNFADANGTIDPTINYLWGQDLVVDIYKP